MTYYILIKYTIRYPRSYGTGRLFRPSPSLSPSPTRPRPTPTPTCESGYSTHRQAPEDTGCLQHYYVYTGLCLA